MALGTNRIWWDKIPVCILLLAIAVRVIVYLQNRSLILDESNLAHNIAQRGFDGLFGSLLNSQISPPLYLCISKLSTLLFGINEYALRLPSIIAGIGSMYVFYLLVKKLITSDIAQCYVLFMLGFSTLAIRYSSEFKQYGFDILLTLIFTLFAVSNIDNLAKSKYFLILTLAGSIAIWLSMPIIFILGAIGLIIFIESITNKKQLFCAGIMGMCWLVSFGLYYCINLRHNISSSSLQSFHSDFFINLSPTSIDSLKESFYVLTRIFKSATDKTFISIAWAMGTFTFGCYVLCKKNRKITLVLLTPMILCLIASHLQHYSLIPRLILFMIPLILLVMGIGISKLWAYDNNILRVAIVIPMIITAFNSKGYKYFINKMEFENIKGVVNYMQSHRIDQEAILVHSDAVSAFRFYNDMHDNAWNFSNYHLSTWEEKPKEIVNQNKDWKRFWILFSHTFPQSNIDQYLESAQQRGKVVDSYQSIEASVYLFRRDDSSE